MNDFRNLPEVGRAHSQQPLRHDLFLGCQEEQSGQPYANMFTYFGRLHCVFESSEIKATCVLLRIAHVTTKMDAALRSKLQKVKSAIS